MSDTMQEMRQGEDLICKLETGGKRRKWWQVISISCGASGHRETLYLLAKLGKAAGECYKMA